MKALKIAVVIVIGLIVVAVLGYFIALGVYGFLEHTSAHTCPATPSPCPQPKLF